MIGGGSLELHAQWQAPKPCSRCSKAPTRKLWDAIWSPKLFLGRRLEANPLMQLQTWLSASEFEELLKRTAQKVESFAGKHIPVALALLAAILATVMLIKAQFGGSSGDKAAKKPAAKTNFTAEEVAEHNKEDDAWIILNGKVYDVTQYVEEHPGGKAILKNAGGDSTKGFHGPQHPERVFDLIDDFYIGEIS